MLAQISLSEWQANALAGGAAFLFGYLLGSIPFGLIFGWLAGAGDVRSKGQGGGAGREMQEFATGIFDHDDTSLYQLNEKSPHQNL